MSRDDPMTDTRKAAIGLARITRTYDRPAGRGTMIEHVVDESHPNTESCDLCPPIASQPSEPRGVGGSRPYIDYDPEDAGRDEAARPSSAIPETGLARSESELLALSALWDCYVQSGADTDGDDGPRAMIAGMGVEGYARAVVESVKQLRIDYAQALAEPAPVSSEPLCPHGGPLADCRDRWSPSRRPSSAVPEPPDLRAICRSNERDRLRSRYLDMGMTFRTRLPMTDDALTALAAAIDACVEDGNLRAGDLSLALRDLGYHVVRERIDQHALALLIKDVTYGGGETLGNAWEDAREIASRYDRLIEEDQ